MAKEKKQKKSSKAPKKVIKINKPKIKISTPKIKISKPNIKFSKLDFKSLFSNKVFKVFLYVLAGIVVFILVDLFVQYLNNGYSVAVVNGSRISKTRYHKELESMYGATIASQLIDERLITLEAKKAGIEATEEEINSQLDDIIQSVGGQEAYEAALSANNLTEQQLKDDIKLDILAREILEPTIEYTDDDVKAFFEQYSSAMFPNETAALEEGEKLDYELYKDQVKTYYIRQQVENEKYTWLESLKSEYSIQDNSVSQPKYGVLTATINIFKNILEDANSNEVETTEETTE